MPTSRTALAVIIGALSALVPNSAAAQATWAPGVIVIQGAGDPKELCTDGQGGIYVGWRDERNISVTDADVFATRITPAGAVTVGFPATGLGVCVAPDYQGFCSIVPDARGGAFLYWLDGRNVFANGGPALYASRITASGGITSGWPVDGLKVSGPLIGDENCPAPVADGNGGGYFFWDNYYTTGNSDVYCLHLSAAGVPAPGWPPGGLPMATGTGVDNQYADGAVSDGQGGVILVWGDGRLDAPGAYAQRVMADGTFAAGWPPSGVRFSPDQGAFDVVSDGAGGVYASLGVEYLTGPNAGFLSTASIIRIAASGQIASGWSFGGNVVCDTIDVRTAPQLASDGLGGVLAQWDDYRNGNYASTFAVRLAPDGTFMPGWHKNGQRVSTLDTYQLARAIIGDGMGGMYSAFESQSSASNLVGVQHLGADGALSPGWSPEGALPTTVTDQYYPTLAEDGAAGAYMAWSNYADNDENLQHYLGGGVVATLLTLISSAADAHNVTLTWSSPTAATLTAAVERRTESGAWQAIGTPSVEGADRLIFADHAVTPGARYGYRLSYLDGASRQYSSETWVDVPRDAVFALEGARPNPAVDHVSAAFSLASDAPASLSLLDVMGREVSRCEVGGMGAGRHVVPLDEGVRTPPGLYWIRLSQGAKSLLARAVVIR